MAEYIEREAVLKLFDGVGCYLNPKCLERQQEQIKQIPSADVVKVIRCKDCKFYQPKNSIGTQGVCMCGEKDMNYSGEFYPYENDFCSYGELKEREGK